MSTSYGIQNILLELCLSSWEIPVGILGPGEDARAISSNEYVYKGYPCLWSGDVEDDKFIDSASDSVKNASMDTSPHMTVIFANPADLQARSACQLALAAWKGLGYRDAGRIDTQFERIGDACLPFVLDVNPLLEIISD